MEKKAPSIHIRIRRALFDEELSHIKESIWRSWTLYEIAYPKLLLMLDLELITFEEYERINDMAMAALSPCPYALCHGQAPAAPRPCQQAPTP